MVLLLFGIIFPLATLHADPSGASKDKRKTVKRPYTPTSPWNLRIGPDPAYDSLSDQLIQSLEGHFGCDPTQYTYPVYDDIDEDTPRRKVTVTGVVSDVTDDGSDLAVRKNTTVEVPIPGTPKPSRGTDGQVIFTDPRTGDEWGFWRFRKKGDGSFVAQNGYHYNTNWSGVPPLGFVSRGAGVPYLAGLVRPEEIRQGRIKHALVFGTPDPSALFAYPATKSDGDAKLPAIPEGARLQLDPDLTEKDFERWGLSRAGKIIARALQEYGMILVDGSGHPKIYVEDHHTAQWEGILHPRTVSPIPYSAFRVLDLNAEKKPSPPDNLRAKTNKTSVTLRWEASPSATRYWIQRQGREKQWVTCNDWVTETSFKDEETQPGTTPVYAVRAVNHNGVSERATVEIK
ncbi:MAG: fibronectin type III domain-containing protein [Planctomycetota bacterium]